MDRTQAASPLLPCYVSRLIEADTHATGLLGETLRAGPQRQQTIAAALALAADGPGIDASLARHLRDSRTRAILPAIDPDLPAAFACLVGNPRFGIRPQATYVALRRWLAVPRDARTLKALRHGPRLTQPVLDALDRLDPAAIHPAMLAVLPNAEAIAALAAEVALVRRLVPDLREHELRAALRAYAADGLRFLQAILAGTDEGNGPPLLLERFEMRMRFPPAPFGTHPRLLALDTPRALVHAGRSMRNCVGRFVQNVAVEDAYFYLWRPATGEPPEAVVHLMRTGSLWRWVRILGPHNAEPADDRLEAVKADLSAVGAIDGTAWPPRLWGSAFWQSSEDVRAAWRQALAEADG